MFVKEFLVIRLIKQSLKGMNV